MRRTIKLKAPRPLPKVLTVQQVQAILDACDHLRDRLLFALMLDTGVGTDEDLNQQPDPRVHRPRTTRTSAPRGRARRCARRAGL